MKRTKQYIGLLLAAIFVAGFSSCIMEDDYEPAEKATVNLVFDTRADGGQTDAGTAPIDVNEGIKTLRVFVTDENGNVEHNEYRTYTDNASRKEVTIFDVSTGIKNFYVIANEASVGLEKTSLDAQTTIDATFLNTVITNPAGNAYFPKMRNQINDLGLPITGMEERVTISREQKNDITIYIKHAVAKVVLNIDNQMSETFWVNGVTLGNFIADATYLFPDRGSYEVGTSGLRTHTFTATTQGFEVSPGENEGVFVFYIYETGKSAAAGDFTIALKSPTVPELNTAKPFFTDRNYLDRNEQLVINATVNVQQEVTITTLEYKVQPWTNVPVTVPPFN